MNTAAHSASSSTRTAERTEREKNPLTADEKMTEAVARIEASRAALIVSMSPDPPERHDGIAGGNGDGSARSSFVQTLAARIERNGLLQGSWQTVRAVARRWWTRQPWHSTVDLVSQTLAHEARPLMRRHPLATLAVGATVGAGLMAAASAVRPWVVQKIRGKNAPWADRVGSLLWTQLSSAPIQMALAGALAAWLADQGSRNARSSGPSSDPAPRHARGDASPSAATSSAP